jgi:RNA polymerase sigma factor (TIGR02999 family)
MVTGSGPLSMSRFAGLGSCRALLSPVDLGRMSDVPRLLSALEQGDPSAAEQLLPLVYEELRRLADQRLAHEKPGQTLQPTALVHEAYLRLVRGGADRHWDGRRHFFAAAAEAMRRILVENARRRKSLKRGGGRARVDLETAEPAAPEAEPDLLALDEALTKLAQSHKVKADLTQLHYFGGLTLAEAGRVLGISAATADRYWAYARAWLHQELTRGSDVASGETSEKPPGR